MITWLQVDIECQVNKRLRGLTKIVKTIATTRIAYPTLLFKNSCRRCLATNTQKMTIGTIISNSVTSSDLASGPNINLPPRMNFCKKRDDKRVKCKIDWKHNATGCWERERDWKGNIISVITIQLKPVSIW